MIDLKTDGCATTTRVAQAIVTVQGLVFLIRSGQIRETSPFEQLQLATAALATFDEDWSWMGSYATWRAAMFVFIHAEVLALPSLRKDRTPAFAELVETLRSAAPATPAACNAAVEAYADYFRELKKQIEANWSYPAEAMRCQQSGRGVIRFVLRVANLCIKPARKRLPVIVINPATQ